MRQPVPFGKYLLLDRISVGGMAEVFRAKSYGVEGFEKIIAIKRILPSMGEDRDFIKMFIDEAKIAGQLAHANICQIFELGRSDGQHFIAMEFIWGKDLLQIQNRFRKSKQVMPMPMACYILSKICEGLDYAHRKKDALGRPLEIVHRDCSPQNVLVSFEGEVKLIDFGIAKAASRSSRTMAGVLKGKFGYMSPEQVRGLPLDRRSDVFALGTMLYESLTGVRLFQGESDFSTLEKVRNVDIVPPTHLNPHIPSRLEGIVMRALEREPDERYQWCSEMHMDLQAFLMAQDDVFSAKNLSKWLRDSFAEEHAAERKQLESYRHMGRDGLIAGVPQAEAKLDVVEHLGEAGDAEDPTMLGGPSFDDIINDTPPPRLVPSGQAGRDFGDEAPTELFGEVGEVSEFSELSDANILSMADAGSAAAQAIESPGPSSSVVVDSAAAHAHAGPDDNTQPPELRSTPAQPTLMEPAGMADIAAQIARANELLEQQAQQQHHHQQYAQQQVVGPGPDTSDFFLGTSNVAPLPTPSGIRVLPEGVKAKKRRRPSVIKDVSIGIGIAVAVLVLFAIGRYMFFGAKPGPSEAAAGTIVVTIPDPQPAEVFLNDNSVGTVAAGKALTLGDQAVGVHRIKVTRKGVTDCERQVDLADKETRVVECTLKPATGELVLKGELSGLTVFVDGLEISPEAAKEPLSLAAGEAHKILVKRDTEVVNEFEITPKLGDKLERPVLPVVAAPSMDAGVAAPGAKVADNQTTKAALPSKSSSTNGSSDSRTTSKPKVGSPSKPKVRDRKRVVRSTRDRVKPKPDAQPTKIPDAKPTKGYFMAYTTPWARVYINGRDTGKSTPIARRARIPLNPGKHRVTFKVGTQKFHYAVVIKAGENSKLVKDLPVSD